MGQYSLQMTFVILVLTKAYCTSFWTPVWQTTLPVWSVPPGQMELGRARNLQYLQCKIRKVWKGVEISEPLSWICRVRKMLQKCPERLWEYVNVCQCMSMYVNVMCFNLFQSVSICFDVLRCFRCFKLSKDQGASGLASIFARERDEKGSSWCFLGFEWFRLAMSPMSLPDQVPFDPLAIGKASPKHCSQTMPMRHKTSDEKPQYPSKIQPVLQPALQWLHQLRPHRSKEVDTRKWWSPVHDRSRSIYIYDYIILYYIILYYIILYYIILYYIIYIISYIATRSSVSVAVERTQGSGEAIAMSSKG